MDRSIRVLMFPWLAHGHFSPFLELAKVLSKRNFITYICSSEVNLYPIQNTLSPEHSISIKLVQLRIPPTPHLPPHLHTTNGLPPHLMAQLKRALDSARPEFSSILATLKPDLVLYDFLQPWAAAEAALQNIPAALFISTGATSASLLTHQMFGDAGSDYPFRSIHSRETDRALLSGRVVRSTGVDADDLDHDHDHARVKDCVERSCDVVFIKTFRELEGKYIDFMSELTRKKVVPVGALVPNSSRMEDEEKYDHIIEWLNRKDRRSTIFASFGSEYFLSEDEIAEIAHGLEMSNVNFIWALRYPAGDEETIKAGDERLPEGLLERVGSERGMVVDGWVPQGRILSHPSVGGFMSHCGWSSVMEGIFSDVPIVAVPMHLDQPMNARMVEEARVGEEVVRKRDGTIDRDGVARVVRRVVVEGEEMRRRAAEIGEIMRDKGEEEIDEVVEEMVKLCNKAEGLDLDIETHKRFNIYNGK